MENYKHQGDITFIPVTKITKGKQETHKGSFLVGYGEATGHHHKVTVANPDDLQVTTINGEYYLSLKSEGTVTHQEHKPITLAPGLYRVGHEREVDHFAHGVVRKVID